MLTWSLVASAFLTASSSKASMALICLATSYVAGLKAAKRFSISSTTAWFLSTERYCEKSTWVGWSWRAWSLRRASSLRFLKAWREVTVWPRRPSEVVTLAQSSLSAELRCEGGGKISSFGRFQARAPPRDATIRASVVSEEDLG